MVYEGDIIRKTVNTETWQKCLDWNEKMRASKSYSKSRQVFRDNQDSFSALAEMYYAKWLEVSLIPATWNGLTIHAGGDDGDIKLAFDGWIDVKAKEIKKPFEREDWEMGYEFIVDDKSLKDTVKYYMFAHWCEPIMQISLCGWLKADELDNLPSSRRVRKGEYMFPGASVIAQNDMTLFKTEDLRPLKSFYYEEIQ